MAWPERGITKGSVEPKQATPPPLGAVKPDPNAPSEDIERLAREPSASHSQLDTLNRQLHRTGAFLQAVIDAIPEITIVIDRDYRVVLANRAAKEMAGGKDPAAGCLKCYQVSHRREIPCEGVHEPCPLKEVLKTERPTTVEHIHYDAAGNEVLVEISAAPIFDDGGKVIQVVESCRNVTEQRLAERTLRDSEERFRTVFESATDAMVAMDSSGLITLFNPSAEGMFGRNREEVLGQSVECLMPEPYRQRHREARKEYFTTGRPKRLNFNAVEMSALHADGRVFPIELSLSAARLGGEPSVLAAIRDITQRKLAEEQLQKEKGISEVTLESLPGVFYEFDEQGHFLRWNGNFERVSGYSRDEILRMHPLDFIALQDKKFIADRIHEVFTTGQAVAEAGLLSKDGRELPYFFTGVRREHEGKRCLLGMGMDITERKRVEEERVSLIAKLEAQNAELERFAYTVSHDLKSPLITIKGYLGLLEQDLEANDPQQIRDDLSRIDGAANRMHELLHEVLQLSRVGRQVNPPEDVALRDLAIEAAELVAGRISEKGARLKVAPHLPVLYGDRHRLREVLQNLIENAVKYMGDQPQPCIEIGARQDGHVVVCLVRDNGVGIGSSYHEKIFGLFDKLDPRSEGAGVGLALAKRIVEVHGGRIWVESDGIGHGSTFCFTIAAKDESAELALPCSRPDR